MMGSRVPGRGALAIAAMLAGALVTAGCSGSYAPEPTQGNLDETEAIVERLRALPGVESVDGVYARSASDAGSVNLSIGVRERSDIPVVTDKAIEEVWRSSIDPILSMTASVGLEDRPNVGDTKNVSFKLDADDLTREYGPRP